MSTAMPAAAPAIKTQAGITILELMVSLALGLLIMVGLTSVFATSSQAHREFHRTSQQIENGRYAMDVLTHDLHHAGYYGQHYRITPAAAAPDPCALNDVGGAITQSLGYAVQGYDAPDWATRPDLTATSCGAWLTAANLVAGSDVLVVRRAETVALAPATVALANDVYLQANPEQVEIQFGGGAAVGTTYKADGALATIKARDGVAAAEIRKFRVHVYFVAPCSVPAGGGDVCTGAGDDSGQPIPTLKRLELGSNGGATAMRVLPIAEGIESLQVDYGVDDSPAAVNSMTGSMGDGSPDRYVRAPTAPEATNIVSARLHVLSRSSEATGGHTDTKTYVLGIAGATGPFNDAFKRHAYAGVVRAVNPSARREIPK